MTLLPRLYPILDVGLLRKSALDIFVFAAELILGGASLIQYRNKQGSPREILSDAQELLRRFPEIRWIMNDRADLALAASFSGVHLGQEDISVQGARKLCPRPMLIGTSTHNSEQLAEADQTDADYLAIGPVFGTASKDNPDPVVGIEGVRAARRLTRKPLVAIGGITAENARAVLDAGADSIAVISSLIHEPRKSTEALIRLLV